MEDNKLAPGPAEPPGPSQRAAGPWPVAESGDAEEAWASGCPGLATRAGKLYKRAGQRQDFLVPSDNSQGTSYLLL